MKLSKNDIDLLANRALDVLQASHDARYLTIKGSKEYKDFEDIYEDAATTELKNLILQKTQIESDIDALRKEERLIAIQTEKLSEMYDIKYKPQWSNSYSTYNKPDALLEAYLENRKEGLFPGAAFNKEKLLNKLKTDLLVSSAKNAQEALDEIIKING